MTYPPQTWRELLNSGAIILGAENLTEEELDSPVTYSEDFLHCDIWLISVSDRIETMKKLRKLFGVSLYDVKYIVNAAPITIKEGVYQGEAKELVSRFGDECKLEIRLWDSHWNGHWNT